MICPYCGKDEDRVIDSRASDGGMAIRRRRECVNCSKRYTTRERVERSARLMVVKKDGSRVAFDSQNILKGLQAACGKRPIAETTKLRLVQEIEEALYRDHDREVASSDIGLRVAARLRDIDEIAYIRYASEYYAFRNLDELGEAVEALKARAPHLPNQQELFAE